MIARGTYRRAFNRRRSLQCLIRVSQETPIGSDVLQDASLRQTLASQGCCSRGGVLPELAKQATKTADFELVTWLVVQAPH
jgi:hypothetical protein